MDVIFLPFFVYDMGGQGAVGERGARQDEGGFTEGWL